MTENEEDGSREEEAARVDADDLDRLSKYSKRGSDDRSRQNRVQRRWQRNKRLQQTAPPRSSEELEALEQFVEATGIGEDFVDATADDVDEGEGRSAKGAEILHLGRQAESELHVKITADAMQAVVTGIVLADGEGVVSVADLKNALETQMGVSHGVDEETLERLLDKEPTTQLEEGLTVARGRQPKRGTNGRVDYPYLEKIHKGRVNGADLAAALETRPFEDGLGHTPPTLLVTPGQVVMRVGSGTPGEPGMSVTGEVLSAPGSKADEIPDLGGGIVAEGSDYRATLYGYPCVLDGALHVLSPIQVSEDALTAVFFQPPLLHPCPAPQSDWLMDMFAAAGVVHGISEPGVERLCREGLGLEPALHVVAEGEAPVDGEDRRFEPAFELSPWPGRILKSGAIEYRDRNKAVAVAKGTEVGLLRPPTPGQTGMDVGGQELPAQDGQESPIDIGEGLQQENRETPEGAVALVATVDGSLRLDQEKIEVLPIVSINGDVDYSCGHIDTRGDVDITGSVLYGFRVRAGGTVNVGGRVENGAVVEAGSDVLISAGIIGEEARVVSGGRLETKLVQNAHIIAEGDVLIGSSLYHAHVRSGGRIDVKSYGREGAGSISGGETAAVVGICAHTIGTVGLEETRVGYGMRPSTLTEWELLGRKVEALDQLIDKARIVSGVESFTPEAINAALATLSKSSAKDSVISALRNAFKAIKVRESLVEKIHEIEEIADTQRAACTIEATGQFQPGARIEFGSQKMEVMDKLGPRVFRLDDEGRLTSDN